MPSFTLTPEEALTLHPLPGHALLKCLPAKLMTESGALHLPEKAAEGEMQRGAVREGMVVCARISPSRHGGVAEGDLTPEEAQESFIARSFLDADSLAILPGKKVFYLGHLDEADNEYVIVKLGQIVAIVEED